jgi:hypothetical protein
MGLGMNINISVVHIKNLHEAIVILTQTTLIS